MSKQIVDQTVSMLGKFIPHDEIAFRDAVHIAVAPVMAGERLEPGDHVGMIRDAAFRNADTIGIVDPFLTQNVPHGARFFLFLYPNTITSLRHVWTHPTFQTIAAAQRKEMT